MFDANQVLTFSGYMQSYQYSSPFREIETKNPKSKCRQHALVFLNFTIMHWIKNICFIKFEIYEFFIELLVQMFSDRLDSIQCISY